MDFLNPIALIFSISMMGINLNHLSEDMATNMSATYVQSSIREDVQIQKCPRSFQIEINTTDTPGFFFLKRISHFSGIEGKAQWIPVDGKTHILHQGEIIKADVLSDRSIEITIFNENLPNEKIIETMTFYRETLSYKARYENDGRPEALELCKEATYSKE